MASGALFSNNTVRGASKNLVELKAGKMTIKGKTVYPDTRKGLLYVYQSDDSLMHLCWKDRTSGVIEDDLIIFPEDCEFKHVPDCKTGRVYLLKFKLSNKKFFFWLQDIKTEKDEEHCKKINDVLNNPPTPGSQRSGGTNPEGDLQNLLNNMSQQQLMQLFGGVGQMGLGNLLGTMRERPHSSRTTTSSTPVTTSATRPPAAQTPAPTTVTPSETPRSSSGTTKTSGSKPASSSSTNLLDRTPATLMSDPHLFDLQRHLWNFPSPQVNQALWGKKTGGSPAGIICCSRSATAELIVRQTDVETELTNSIPAAITSSESLERTMSKHLPSGDNLCTTLSSPQFSQALSMFWSALQSGQGAPMVRQFGLGPDTVNAAATGNLEEFVTALETETKKDQEQTSSTTVASSNPEDESTKKDDSSSAKKDDSKDDEMALD
ncbi:Similar to adrm1b: Proteasomal ubiquitin receptor ADRM1 (Danio rerio) [Cotesia congregata]|uniref:Proteasomal ubiquitin receptor ADRM1 homolog n=1 Tax=Cotesia congregata TaxID=51543 RepID=A0A8J2HHW7_COTCN|nr:Similar to adrm1b: Proteasomal ubiquitin receptor ADRM1 (Danio rerio) [Cotesia congregata]